MLTLNTAGKSETEAVNLVREVVMKNSENELKILIEGPLQAEYIKNFLATQGFDNILPEDDEGLLYLMASRPKQQEKKAKTDADDKEYKQDKLEQETEQPAPKPEKKFAAIKNSTGVLISCETGKYTQKFYRNFLSSLIKAENKPDILALINGAVKLAAYNSQTCDFLKKLEAQGVKIFISEACADRLAMTGAIGAGVIIDMSEILDEIFACDKVISV
ncbi:MAG: hypothetical protein IJU48_05880 [Synergistaceae bacterium]|nr:hypothetical protein [Synergistaceae bacterium]